MEHFYKQQGDIFIDGQIAVVHADGYQLGYFKATEFGWNFCMEYREPTDDQ